MPGKKRSARGSAFTLTRTLGEDWGRYRVLGATRDDAAGEAFDKTARLLGLGYPGGPAIERLAREGDAERHPFPVPMSRSNQRLGDADYYDMSFSGLKTAVLMRVRELESAGRLKEEIPHLSAGFQRAALDQLVEKTARAVKMCESRRVILGGGVARNKALAAALGERLTSDVSVLIPEPRLATDNAAMVARSHRPPGSNRRGRQHRRLAATQLRRQPQLRWELSHAAE